MISKIVIKFENHNNHVTMENVKITTFECIHLVECMRNVLQCLSVCSSFVVVGVFENTLAI